MERIVSVMQRLARWRLVMAIVVMYMLPSALCAAQTSDLWMVIAYDTHEKEWKFLLRQPDKQSSGVYDIYAFNPFSELNSLGFQLKSEHISCDAKYKLHILVAQQALNKESKIRGQELHTKMNSPKFQTGNIDFVWRLVTDLNGLSAQANHFRWAPGEPIMLDQRKHIGASLTSILQNCSQDLVEQVRDIGYKARDNVSSPKPRKKQGRHAGGGSLKLHDLEAPPKQQSDCVGKMGKTFDTGGYAWPRPEQPDAIHFYTKSNPYYEFTNTYSPKNEIVIDSKKWRSVEHYFQAHKFQKPREVYEQYLQNMPAGTLQKASRNKQSPFDGKKYNMLSDKKWYGKNFDVMYRALQHKFAPNTPLGNMLKNTGNKFLVEDTAQATGKPKDKDTLYGAGDYYTGCNMLGQMLMYVREELQGERKPSQGKFPGFQTPKWWYNRLFSSHGQPSGGRGQHKRKKHGDDQKLKKALERLGGALHAIS